MDALEFVARSEWPFVVAGTLLLFRRPIKELLLRINLTKIDAWGIKAEFERGLDKVEELSFNESPLSPEKFTQYLRGSREAMRDWPMKEDVTPEAVVLDAWSRFEGDMRAMTDALHPRNKDPLFWTPPLRIQEAAKEFGLSDEDIKSLLVLRSLRNKIAHASGERSLTWEDAARFKDATQRVLAKMKSRWEELKKK